MFKKSRGSPHHRFLYSNSRGGRYESFVIRGEFLNRSWLGLTDDDEVRVRVCVFLFARLSVCLSSQRLPVSVVVDVSVLAGCSQEACLIVLVYIFNKVC